MIDSDIKKIFSRRIIELRKKKNLTQSEFGEIIGVGISTVSDWENAKKLARAGAIQKIADYFKVPKSYLFEETEHQSKPQITKRQQTTIDRYLKLTSQDKVDDYVDLLYTSEEGNIYDKETK